MKRDYKSYKSNYRIPIGKEDHDIIDTNNEMTSSPKIHVNISPSAMLNVKNKIIEMLQVKVPGPVVVEFSNGIRDTMANAPNVFTIAMNIEVAGQRPANVVLGKAWDSEKKQRSDQYQVERSKYRSDTNTAISTIDSNFIDSTLRTDLMREQIYKTALNRVRSGSILDYWDVLQNLLQSRVEYMKPGKSLASVILKQITDLCIDDTGDALLYYDKIVDLRLKLEEAMIDSQVASVISNIELPAETIEIIRNNVRSGVIDEIDGNPNVIFKVWNEFYSHNDNNGAAKFKHLLTVNSIKDGETPYTMRVREGDSIKGGLNNLLIMAKENLDRIKANNPSRKILYKRKEVNIGKELKISDIHDSKIAINNQTIKGSQDKGHKKQKIVGLESDDGVDFKNKSPTSGHCFFCRDQLCKYAACKSHSYVTCHYNLSENGTSTSKKTATERKADIEKAKPLRDLAKSAGRHR